MNVRRDLTDLATRVAALSSDVRAELATFPSGAAMLDVRYKGRLFVLAYSAAGDFELDEIEEDLVGLGTSFRHHYDDFSAAKEKLLSLLTAASSAGPTEVRTR